ncbi:hypothetical protein RUM43_007175 [Polyplax serrata]|uniref:SDE2-like domain-containing protein n=1 Tax=Polyplax serrata TaxID=468196 RepID=A0AAN8P585_POLSC
MIHLVFDLPPYSNTLTLDNGSCLSNDDLKQLVTQYSDDFLGTTFDFYLLHNGKIYSGEHLTDGVIHVIPRLPGGKGGFGSMLRAIGAQIEKTTNREACRDLSGRRLRDINEEKRLKKWLAEQAEREQEAVRKKKRKLEKLTKIVKHNFEDEEYAKARVEMPEKINEALEEGLKVTEEEPSSSEVAKKPKEKAKKIKGNLWVDDLDSLEDSESDDEVTKKKAKTT